MLWRSEAACGAAGRVRVLTLASSSVNAIRQQVSPRNRAGYENAETGGCVCGAAQPASPRCLCAFSRAGHQMDNLYAIIATALIGVVGVAIFLLNQPAEAKKKSKGPGLKPRDDWHAQ